MCVQVFAIITVFFCISAFGNGANDVANSYSTSVAARTLTMPEVGFLSTITEFTGAVALGANVMSTIRNDIIGIERFNGHPGVLMLAMGCAEIGSATWLVVATRWGYRRSCRSRVASRHVCIWTDEQALKLQQLCPPPRPSWALLLE